jgi:hypothetical protein
LDEETGMPLDVVLAGRGLEKLFFQRVVRIRAADVEIPFASAEDVLIMKYWPDFPKISRLCGEFSYSAPRIWISRTFEAEVRRAIRPERSGS